MEPITNKPTSVVTCHKQTAVTMFIITNNNKETASLTQLFQLRGRHLSQ
jgi:hypothetical protein